MALSYLVKKRAGIGDMTVRIVDVTLDAAYAAGGYALTPQMMGFGSNGSVLFVLPSPIADGFLMEWDEAGSRLKVRDASGGVGAVTPEVANNLAGLNGVVVRVLAFGVGHG